VANDLLITSYNTSVGRAQTFWWHESKRVNYAALLNKCAKLVTQALLFKDEFRIVETAV
jgi:hypothetical protein